MPTKETTRKNEDAITVGSCDVYVVEYEGAEVPDYKEVCAKENHLAHSKGGCTVNLSKETKTITDDFEVVSKTVKISHELKVKLGLIGWNGNTLAKLESANQVTEDTETGIRCTKLGGSHDDGKKYTVVLHHPDATDGDMWIQFIGKNTAGLSLAYATDEETKVEPEFTGEPMPDGYLVYLYEQIGKLDPSSEVAAG